MVEFSTLTGVRSIVIGLVAILAVSSEARAADTRPRDSSGWVPCSTNFAPLGDADAAGQVIPTHVTRAPGPSPCAGNRRRSTSTTTWRGFGSTSTIPAASERSGAIPHIAGVDSGSRSRAGTRHIHGATPIRQTT